MNANTRECNPKIAAVHFFERPCPAGWGYPCSLEDIVGCLARLPEQDLEGLWAAGLVPATRKDGETDGRYYFGAQPTIHLFSYPDTLRFKLRAQTRPGDIERGLAIQRQYGMAVERQGSRYICEWSSEHLRCFVVEHVLLHEVGHHVYFWRRQQQGHAYSPNLPGAEQFAEDYALRRRNLWPYSARIPTSNSWYEGSSRHLYGTSGVFVISLMLRSHAFQILLSVCVR